MNVLRTTKTDECAVLRFAADMAQRVAVGDEFELSLADGSARLFDADGGTGLTTWKADADGAASLSVVTSAGDDMSPGQVSRASALATDHPSFSEMARVGTTAPVRTSDLVEMEEFWQTPVFAEMHGWVPGARYPVAILLHASASYSTFLGLHRSARDFDDDDLRLLGLLQRLVAPAVAHRVALDGAVRRLAMLGALDSDAGQTLTGREKEALALAAMGLTTGAIGRRLGISERTARKHLSSVYQKTGVGGRAAAVAWWSTNRPRHDHRFATNRVRWSGPLPPWASSDPRH
jgi:DNA-binding CsgD family transcriptional regulator